MNLECVLLTIRPKKFANTNAAKKDRCDKNTKVNCLNFYDVMVEMENDTLAIQLFGNPKNFPIYPFPYLVMTRLRKYSSQKESFSQK